MKLGILWWEPGEVECLGIADVCRQRGHEVVLFGLEEIGCQDTHMGTVPTIAGTEAGDLRRGSLAGARRCRELA